MTRSDVSVRILKSDVFQQWHWFRYHFNSLSTPDREHPLASSIVDALLVCDRAMPGYAEKFVGILASIGGREKFEPHYEQLLQLLAELHVVYRVVSFDWPGGAKFRSEPTAVGSKKNPEITIEHAGLVYGIEVKSPALLSHIRQRGSNPTQVPSRVFSPEMLSNLPDVGEGLTRPRDNPVKDFLLSANGKFESFCSQFSNFVGLLVIVWDDFIYEPISALVHPASGLLTAKSFFKDGLGNAVAFPNVNGVVVIRHIHQIVRATRDEDLIDECRHALDYGRQGEFPWKAYIQNPSGQPSPEVLLRCLQAEPLSDKMGAEYRPQDLIWWFRT